MGVLLLGVDETFSYRQANTGVRITNRSDEEMGKQRGERSANEKEKFLSHEKDDHV